MFITRDDVAEYVKARLGYPVLDLELELEEKNGLGHIYLAIQDTLDWFYRYNADEAIYHDWMVLYLQPGIIEYEVPESVVTVVDVAPTFGNGFTPWTSFDVGPMESLTATTAWSQFDIVSYTGAMRYIADVQKLVGIQYQVRFHPDTHRIRIMPTPRQPRAAMCKIYRKASMSAVFSNILFRDMVTYRTKIIWGEIISRDKVTMPGGGSVDGERLLSDARSDLKELQETVRSESAPPFILTDLSM